jgi:Holliday junction resolvase
LDYAEVVASLTYRKGRQFEYEVKRFLENDGWFVRRAYASKGIFDLLAYKDGAKWGIQCKSLAKNPNRLYLPKKEDEELKSYAVNPTIPYEFVQYHKSYRMPVLEKLEDVFQVIHAYNTFPNIGWRKLVNNEWISFKY